MHTFIPYAWQSEMKPKCRLASEIYKKICGGPIIYVEKVKISRGSLWAYMSQSSWHDSGPFEWEFVCVEDEWKAELEKQKATA